jgi:ribosomal protein S18 acetylase RimI-like enzyme
VTSTTPEARGYSLRPAALADAPALARLHVQTLPGEQSDLTLLGARLVRHFYANAIARGTVWVHVAEERGELLGLVVVTRDIGSMFSRTLLAGPRDVLAFLVRSSPLGLLRATIAKLASGTARVPAVPELVYLGVSGRARGRGVGAALMEAAHSEFRRQGIAAYQLHVHADNAPAVRLYLAHGLEEARRFRKGGREMLNMRKRLD